MAKPGPRPYTDRPIHLSFTAPQSLVTEVKTLLLDPMTGRTKQGAMSGLIVGFLRDWVNSQKKDFRTSGDNLNV